MTIDNFDFNIIADLEQIDITELPQSIADCYNSLCKYAKPEKTETSICYERCESDSRISLYVTMYSDGGDIYSTYFDEGKDFNLSDTEREALSSKMMELARQSRTA